MATMQRDTIPSQPRETFLPPDTISTIQKAARKLNIIEQARSQKQFYFGRLANETWEALKDRPDIAGELTKHDLYIEISYWANECLPFPIMAESGETLRRWAETAAFFQEVPAIDAMAEVLSFEHFHRARKLYNGGWVDAADAPLAVAINNKLTAEEMTLMFTDPPAIEPVILELRQKYPEWCWTAAYRLAGLNGEREQAEYHLREFVRLVSNKPLTNNDNHV